MFYTRSNGMRVVCKVRRYPKLAVDEVHWSDRLNRFNHNPHFPYLVTHFTDAMPISSIGGALSDMLFNPDRVCGLCVEDYGGRGQLG